VDRSTVKGPVRALVRRYGGRLRFPKLLTVTAVLFAVDLAVPDVIPFADEILLGLATVVLASLRTRREQARQAASR